MKIWLVALLVIGVETGLRSEPSFESSRFSSSTHRPSFSNFDGGPIVSPLPNGVDDQGRLVRQAGLFSGWELVFFGFGCFALGFTAAAVTWIFCRDCRMARICCGWIGRRLVLVEWARRLVYAPPAAIAGPAPPAGVEAAPTSDIAIQAEAGPGPDAIFEIPLFRPIPRVEAVHFDQDDDGEASFSEDLMRRLARYRFSSGSSSDSGLLVMRELPALPRSSPATPTPEVEDEGEVFSCD